MSSSLTWLSVRNNRLTDQSLSVLSAFTKLMHLYLDGNAITAIPPMTFRRMNDLVTLSLGNNRITRLNNDSFQGIERTVHKLILTRNRIDSVDAGTFSLLHHIRRLDLSNNQITRLTLPSVMSELNYLSVARNKLREFPAGLRSSVILLSLDLSSNQIAQLPRFDFFSDNVIQLINFADNSLTSVDDMRYLGTVDVLDFSRNLLSDVGADILNRTTTVGLLDLSHNRFARVPTAVSRSTHVVRDLRLDFNDISTLSNWTGPSVQRSDVEKLSLRGNDIGELTADFMAAVRASLVQLDLRDNRLRTLDPVLFDNITYLTHLMLDGNPLHCDCELAWLRQLALRVTVDYATCRSPADVAGELAICYNISSCADVAEQLHSIADVRCSEDYRPTTAATTETATSSPAITEERATSGRGGSSVVATGTVTSSPHRSTTSGPTATTGESATSGRGGGTSSSHVALVTALVLVAVLVLVVVVMVWWVCRRLRRRGVPPTAGENWMNEYTTPYSSMNTTTTLDDDLENDTKT